MARVTLWHRKRPTSLPVPANSAEMLVPWPEKAICALQQGACSKLWSLASLLSPLVPALLPLFSSPVPSKTTPRFCFEGSFASTPHGKLPNSLVLHPGPFSRSSWHHHQHHAMAAGTEGPAPLSGATMATSLGHHRWILETLLLGRIHPPTTPGTSCCSSCPGTPQKWYLNPTWFFPLQNGTEMMGLSSRDRGHGLWPWKGHITKAPCRF